MLVFMITCLVRKLLFAMMVGILWVISPYFVLFEDREIISKLGISFPSLKHTSTSGIANYVFIHSKFLTWYNPSSKSRYLQGMNTERLQNSGVGGFDRSLYWSN